MLHETSARDGIQVFVNRPLNIIQLQSQLDFSFLTSIAEQYIGVISHQPDRILKALRKSAHMKLVRMENVEKINEAISLRCILRRSNLCSHSDDRNLAFLFNIGIKLKFPMFLNRFQSYVPLLVLCFHCGLFVFGVQPKNFWMLRIRCTEYVCDFSVYVYSGQRLIYFFYPRAALR